MSEKELEEEGGGGGEEKTKRKRKEEREEREEGRGQVQGLEEESSNQITLSIVTQRRLGCCSCAGKLIEKEENVYLTCAH